MYKLLAAGCILATSAQAVSLATSTTTLVQTGADSHALAKTTGHAEAIAPT